VKRVLVALVVVLGVVAASPAFAADYYIMPVAAKSCSPQTVRIGEPVTCHITLTNSTESNIAFYETYIRDRYSGSPTLVSSTLTRPDGTTTNDVCYDSTEAPVNQPHFRCDALGSLQVGQTESVDITFVYDTPGTYTDTAETWVWVIQGGGTVSVYDDSQSTASDTITVLGAPASKADCRHGGYADFGFASQKECMRFLK